jgi:hypothetical protein
MPITSKQILHILEEYKDLFRIRGMRVTVFVNPSRSDVVDLGKKVVRFLAVANTKEVYIWDGLAAVHSEVFNELGIPYHGIEIMGYKFPTDVLYGIADAERGSLKMVNSHPLEFTLRSDRGDADNIKLFTELTSHDWRWVDRYVQGTQDYVDDIIKIFKKA